MPLTFSDALAQIERGEAVRRANHEAEALRQQLTLRGCDMGPFQAMTQAEKDAEAKSRVAAYNSIEARTVRELTALERAGSREASRIIDAYWREDPDWMDRARELFASQAREAA